MGFFETSPSFDHIEEEKNSLRSSILHKKVIVDKKNEEILDNLSSKSVDCEVFTQPEIKSERF